MEAFFAAPLGARQTASFSLTKTTVSPFSTRQRWSLLGSGWISCCANVVNTAMAEIVKANKIFFLILMK